MIEPGPAPCPYCDRLHGGITRKIASGLATSDGLVAAYLRQPGASDAFLATLLYGGAVGLHARGRQELGARLHALADEVSAGEVRSQPL